MLSCGWIDESIFTVKTLVARGSERCGGGILIKLGDFEILQVRSCRSCAQQFSIPIYKCCIHWSNWFQGLLARSRAVVGVVRDGRSCCAVRHHEVETLRWTGCVAKNEQGYKRSDPDFNLYGNTEETRHESDLPTTEIAPVETCVARRSA